MSITRKIKVIGNTYRENFYCTLCKYPLLTGEDFEVSKEYTTCSDCFQTFIEGRQTEWKNGKRPEKTKVRDYILIKNKLNSKEIK